MSLAAALKKGQAAIDTLGNWDPFSEAAGAPAPAPAKSGAARSVPANVNGSADRRPSRAAASPPQATDRGPAARPPSHLRAVREPGSADAAAANAAAPARAVPTQARAVLSAKAVRPGPARAKDKATWLHDGVPNHGRVNAAQYVRELDRFIADETRRAVADTVMDVNPAEIEGVARLAARIKGRYLAKLLDLGNPSKSTVQDTEVRELTRYRETYEELARGLDLLKVAIEAGDVGVSGMVRR